MQSKIQETLGLDPVDKEVIVLYEGEKAEQSTDDLKNKRIVEMKKPRPMWFFGRVMQHGQKYLKQTCSTAKHRSLCTQRKGGPISISTDIGSWVNSTITSLSILIVGKN